MSKHNIGVTDKQRDETTIASLLRSIVCPDTPPVTDQSGIDIHMNVFSKYLVAMNPVQITTNTWDYAQLCGVVAAQQIRDVLTKAADAAFYFEDHPIKGSWYMTYLDHMCLVTYQMTNDIQQFKRCVSLPKMVHDSIVEYVQHVRLYSKEKHEDFGHVIIGMVNRLKAHYISGHADIERNRGKNSGASFLLMTYNVNEHNARPHIYIDNSGCDVVCTQEENNNRYIDHLKKPVICGSKNEKLGLHLMAQTNNNANVNVACTTTDGVHGTPKRDHMIFEYKGLKICNVHLQGGVYVDSNIIHNPTSKDDILQNKLAVLQSAIEKDPDIILGDFNSVYSTDSAQHTKMMDGQYLYFADLAKKNNVSGLDQEFIKTLNEEPIRLLQQKGYVYAKPKNEGSMSTTSFGTICDMIWYKNKKIEKITAYIEDTLDPGPGHRSHIFSDHNPVWGQVFLKATWAGA